MAVKINQGLAYAKKRRKRPGRHKKKLNKRDRVKQFL